MKRTQEMMLENALITHFTEMCMEQSKLEIYEVFMQMSFS